MAAVWFEAAFCVYVKKKKMLTTIWETICSCTETHLRQNRPLSETFVRSAHFFRKAHALPCDKRVALEALNVSN